MTLIERCVGNLSMEDYEFHAERLFCKPSEKTLALARKVFNRLDKQFDAEFDAWCRRNSDWTCPIEWLY